MYETEIAIGWLARENKISYDDGKYFLAPTNLTTSIGSNAGDLWHLLNNHGKASVQHIIKESTLPTQELYKAVGWLAREEKINIELE
ncbi:MAG: winged helix-turn-helix domain-containing protein [Candidatus Thermoplasmatota archaeon]|nr:winged helix-turn-helix domain-containing protein [Candidatus Thermoplasmatota archaeon]